MTGLYKQFTGKRMTKVDALKGLDLEIAAGEVFGFLGPNGAGKSTTIKLVMGLLRPTAGSARIMGIDSGQSDSRRQVGFLPENPAFYDYLSAEEYISFVGSQFKMDAALLRRRSEEVLQRMDLWEARKRPMRGYSKGMVQRVGLAQALVHDPDVYILDEPMSGLDPVGRALVKDIMRELKARGKCVFFSTHITADVETVCDRVGVISKGELKAVQRVDSILTEGITGYRVQIKRREGVVETVAVAKEDLNGFVETLARQGETIWLIEPERKNLEEFFLDTIGRTEPRPPFDRSE
jgi:ABC-2 type transport system ATP-binding protein